MYIGTVSSSFRKATADLAKSKPEAKPEEKKEAKKSEQTGWTAWLSRLLFGK